MPIKHGSQVDFQKIPVLGLVAESSATGSPPASPSNGQFWFDTTAGRAYVREAGAWVLISQTGSELLANKGAASGYASLDSGTKVPIAQIPTGTSGSTVPFGNDARFSDNRTPIDGSVTGGPAGAGVKIAAATITHDNVAAANKDGVVGTPSMRTLAYTSQAAMPGDARLDQIANPTASRDMNSQKIINLGAPTGANDGARLIDVQNAQAGIDLKPSVRVASTANVAVATGLANGQTVDGVTLVTGDRVLLKNQSTASENGVYIAPASGAASRAADSINANALWLVEEGTANGDTSWMVTTNNPITVGSTNLTLAQFGAGGTTYTGTSNRVTVTGAVIDIAATYVGQTSITTLGTITTGTWTGTDIAVADGGTGASTAVAARSNLGATGKYSVTLGALTAGAEATITHNLNSTEVIASFRNASDDSVLMLNWRPTGVNTIGVTADLAYSASAVKAVVIG